MFLFVHDVDIPLNITAEVLLDIVLIHCDDVIGHVIQHCVEVSVVQCILHDWSIVSIMKQSPLFFKHDGLSFRRPA